MNKELTYWLALTHMPEIKNRKKNDIIIKLFKEDKNIIDFFESEYSSWENKYELNKIEIEIFLEAQKKLTNYAFMVEDLLEQGYNIIPITSQEYSPVLKKNLGRSYAPPIIYTKGNIQIMKEKSVAIVGSRKANENSLKFTDNIAQKAAKEHKVIISGFAKGVDKQALDSALKYKAQSIIVLPQGITTFQSGFKQYYKHIIDGNVLVLSTFHPKSPWSVQLAMARNSIIYGLSSEIYVAESSEKGGTWSGAMDGLKKGRTIYVRKTNPREKNANNILISKGGKAVDITGNLNTDETQIYLISETISVSSLNNIEAKIIDLLKNGDFSAKQIVNRLEIDWTARKVSDFLKNREDVLTIKGKPLKFKHKDKKEPLQCKFEFSCFD